MFYFAMQLRADFHIRRIINGVDVYSVAPKFRGLVAALEADADRAAWAALCPGEPLPIRPEMAMSTEILEEALGRFKDERAKYRFPIKPISTDPRLHVPYRHVKHGIPWAGPMTITRHMEA